MRRRCGTSSGNPEIASVSSVFTSCAPDNGINLYPASKRALAQDAHHRDRAREPQSGIVDRDKAADAGGVLQDRREIAIEIGVRPRADRPLVGVADHLDDVDVVFADVFENLERRLDRSAHRGRSATVRRCRILKK